MGVALAIGVDTFGNRIRPVRNDRPVKRFQTDQFPPVRIGHMGPLMRALAQIVGLLFRERPLQVQILRNNRAIGFVADHDKALLGAHDVQRLGAVRHHAKLFARLQQHIPERASLTGRHRNLVGQLARERDAINPRVKPAQRPVSPLHER